MPDLNPLGIKRFVPGISISFQCECYIRIVVISKHFYFPRLFLSNGPAKKQAAQRQKYLEAAKY